MLAFPEIIARVPHADIFTTTYQQFVDMGVAIGYAIP